LALKVLDDAFREKVVNAIFRIDVDIPQAACVLFKVTHELSAGIVVGEGKNIKHVFSLKDPHSEGMNKS
jgi:hypothetical protein